jgi:hypothetical protein
VLLDLGCAHLECHCEQVSTQNRIPQPDEKSDITGISSNVLSVRFNASAMPVNEVKFQQFQLEGALFQSLTSRNNRLDTTACTGYIQVRAL